MSHPETNFGAEVPVAEKPPAPEYLLEEGVTQLHKRVLTLLSERTGTIVVGIAGGSASGKTNAVAHKLEKMLGADAMIFSMDDYYIGQHFMDAQEAAGNPLNWDQPESIDMSGFKAYLKELKAGLAIQKPIFSFLTNEAEGSEELRPRRVVIVEGLFALGDTIQDEMDVKAFVETSTHGRLTRRVLRDVKRAGQHPDHIERYFRDVVEPMHQKYVESTKHNADLIIHNEYDPTTEGVRTE